MDHEEREERVKDVFAAMSSVEYSAAEKVSDELRAITGILKKTREDALLEHPRRGAVWEYSTVLRELNKLDKHAKVANVVPAIDSRAHKDKQALERWRDAECLALNPHTFAALRHIPELKQIISHTAVAAIHACASKLKHLEVATLSEKQSQHLAAAEADNSLMEKDPETKLLKKMSDTLGQSPAGGLFSAVCCDIERKKLLDPDRCLLLEQLVPGLRLCLAAEVAVGMLCPGQPPPPDTPEHAAALQMFVAEAEKHIIAELNQTSSNLVQRIGPEYNAAAGIKAMWQHMDTWDAHAKLPRQGSIPAWPLAPHLDLQLQLPPQQLLQLLCWLIAHMRLHQEQLQHQQPAEQLGDEQEQQGDEQQQRGPEQQQQWQAAVDTVEDTPDCGGSCGGSCSREQLHAAGSSEEAEASVTNGQGGDDMPDTHVSPEEEEAVAAATAAGRLSLPSCDNHYTLPFAGEELPSTYNRSVEALLGNIYQHLMSYAGDSSSSTCSGKCLQQMDAFGQAELQQQRRAHMSQLLPQLPGFTDDTQEAAKHSSYGTRLQQAILQSAVNLALNFLEQQWSTHGVNSPVWQQAVPLQMLTLCDVLNQIVGFMNRCSFDASSMDPPEQCSLQTGSTGAACITGSTACGGSSRNLRDSNGICSSASVQHCGSSTEHSHVAVQHPSSALQQLVAKVLAMVHLVRGFNQANAALKAAVAGTEETPGDTATRQAYSSSSNFNGNPGTSPDVFFSSQGPLASGLWGFAEPLGFGLWADPETLADQGDKCNDISRVLDQGAAQSHSSSNGTSQHVGSSAAATAAEAFNGPRRSSSSLAFLQQQQQQSQEARQRLNSAWQVFFATGIWQHAADTIDGELQGQLEGPHFAAYAAAGAQALAQKELSNARNGEHRADQAVVLNAEAQELLNVLGVTSTGASLEAGIHMKSVSEVVADQLLESKLALLQAFGLMGPLRKRIRKGIHPLSWKRVKLTGVTMFSLWSHQDEDYMISSDEEDEEQHSSRSSSSLQLRQRAGHESPIAISSDDEDLYDYRDLNLSAMTDCSLLDDPEFDLLSDMDLDSDPQVAALQQEYRQLGASVKHAKAAQSDLLQQQQQQPYGAYDRNASSSSSRYKPRGKSSSRSRCASARATHEGCSDEWTQHAATAAAEAAAAAFEVTELTGQERREALIAAQQSYRNLASEIAKQFTPLWRWYDDWLGRCKYNTQEAQAWWSSPQRAQLASSTAAGCHTDGQYSHIVEAVQRLAAAKLQKRAGDGSSSSSNVWNKGKYDVNIHCPLCRKELNSDLGQSSSSSSSLFPNLAVPFDDPFMWRRLLWQLLGKLSPEAQAFYAQYAAVCPHASDASVWSSIRRSVQAALWSPQQCDAVDMQLAAPGQTWAGSEARQEQQAVRIMQFARALNKSYVQGHRHGTKPGLMVLAQHVLLSLSPLHKQLLPGPEVAMLCPSSFHAAVGKELMSQLTQRVPLDLFQHEQARLQMWHVWWHIGLRRYRASRQQQELQDLDHLYLDADARLYAVGFAARQLSAAPTSASMLHDALCVVASAATVTKAKAVTNNLKAHALLECLHLAGPEGSQAGPDQHQAGPDSSQGVRDMDAAAAVVHALNLTDVTDEEQLTAAAAAVCYLLASAPVRSYDSSKVLPKRLVEQYYNKASFELAAAALNEDNFHQQKSQQQQQQQQQGLQGQQGAGEVAASTSVTAEQLTHLGAIALSAPAPLDALMPAEAWWCRQQQLLGLDRVCELCGHTEANGVLCEFCGCALYCGDQCKQQDAEHHAEVCRKLAAASKRYAGPSSAASCGAACGSLAPFPLLVKLLQPQADDSPALAMDCKGISGRVQQGIVTPEVYLQQTSELLARLNQHKLLGCA